MIMHLTRARRPFRCRATLSLAVEDIDPHEARGLTGVIWDHVSHGWRTHSELEFEGDCLRIYTLESRSDPTLLPDIHVREVLDRIGPGDKLLSLVQAGALLTLYVRLFGAGFFEAVELAQPDLRRLAKIGAYVSWYSSTTRDWDRMLLSAADSS